MIVTTYNVCVCWHRRTRRNISTAVNVVIWILYTYKVLKICKVTGALHCNQNILSSASNLYFDHCFTYENSFLD